MKKLLMVLPLVLFAGMAFFLAGGLKKDPSLLPSARLQKPFPEFSLSSLQDPATMITAAGFKGPALVNVWATWCPNCRQEHPALMDLAARGIRIYGIDYKDERDEAISWLERLGNPYQAVVFDEKGALGFDLGVYGAPETFVIDANGVIVHRLVGEVSSRTWEQELLPLWQSLQPKP